MLGDLHMKNCPAFCRGGIVMVKCSEDGLRLALLEGQHAEECRECLMRQHRSVAFGIEFAAGLSLADHGKKECLDLVLGLVDHLGQLGIMRGKLKCGIDQEAAPVAIWHLRLTNKLVEDRADRIGR